MHRPIVLLELLVDRDGGSDCLALESEPSRLDQARELAERIGDRVQDESDACGHQVRARCVLTLQDDRQVQTVVQCRPTDASEALDSSAVDALSGTHQSLVIQAQRHVEALVRMSVQERETVLNSMAQMLEHLGQTVSDSLDRQRAEEQRSEEFRRREDELREELAALSAQLESAEEDELPPHLQALLGAVTQRLLGAGTGPRKPPPKQPEDPPPH